MRLSGKLIALGLLFLATLATGLWRGNTGSPAFPGLLHKPLGITWIVYTGIVVCYAWRPVEPRAAFLSAIVILAVTMVALIATGSLLTVPQYQGSAWLNAHSITSAIAAIASGVTLRLLMLSGK